MAVLEHDHAAADTPAREGTLRALARLSMFRGRYEESLSFAQQALAAARRLGAPGPLAWALNAVGSALSILGRAESALQANEDALELARRLGDGVLMFTVLNSIASSRHRAGELDAAERCYREALELARQHAGRVGIVIVLDNLIRVLVARGELDEARRFAIECLPLARDEKVSVDLLEATRRAGLAPGRACDRGTLLGRRGPAASGVGIPARARRTRACRALARELAPLSWRCGLRSRRGGGTRVGVRSGHARAGAMAWARTTRPYFFVSSSCPAFWSRSLRPLAIIPSTPGSSISIVTGGVENADDTGDGLAHGPDPEDEAVAVPAFAAGAGAAGQ